MTASPAPPARVSPWLVVDESLPILHSISWRMSGLRCELLGPGEASERERRPGVGVVSDFVGRQAGPLSAGPGTQG